MTTEPQQVCIKGSEKLIGYACPKCHLFCSPLIYACGWDDGLTAAHNHAKTCCADRMCSECNTNMGSPKETHWLICQDCRQMKDNAKENKLYREAKKIPLAEYKGDLLYYMDEFYDEEVIQDNDTFDELPKYAWACSPHDLTLEAADIVSSALEHGDHHEDAFEEVNLRDLSRLQRYLDAWCKKVAIRSWMPDFNLAVILPPAERE